MENLTPMMKQYYAIKEKYKNYLVFFRVGDFFELFDEDAKIASKELGIALTTRDKKHLMAGVPAHALYTYVKRLLEKGYSVVICDQVEEPSKAKGIVKREIVRILTPGTLIEEELLTKDNNYLICIYKDEEKEEYGIAIADISTGDFFVTSVKNIDDVIAEVLKFSPIEGLISNTISLNYLEELKKLIPVVHSWKISEDFFDYSVKLLKNHIENFEIINLKIPEIIALGKIIDYIKNTLLIDNIKITVQKYEGCNYMILNTTTLKNLELFKNIVDGTTRGTLLELLDKTKTAMGSRLLKKWLQRPLINIIEIENRLNAVEELINKTYIRKELRTILEEIYDLDRISSRITFKKVNPKDLIALKKSLKAVSKLKKYKFISPKLDEIINNLENLEDVVELIDKAIVDDPPVNIKDGGIIKEGYCKELDSLRKLKDHHEEYLKELEEREKQRTGIQKLKIKYNSVIGYYIEVPKSQSKFVPSYYKKVQTLVNYERYTISELETLQEKILSSEERIKELEYNLFLDIRDKIYEKIDNIKKTSKYIAELDILSTFAEISVLYNYTKPKVTTGYNIIIKNGRHPTVEKYTNFVPNDVILSEDQRILIITGPNMAGKSTYLRMVGLITIMAQIGCFVPADYAIIGIVDSIFTRLGTTDDITRGYSSFMIELLEVDQIIRKCTPKSLVILDELGKSTESREGTALAWSIIEYLNKKKVKTLFATHFYDLTRLEDIYKEIKNYHFEVIEENGILKFDRKIKPGPANISYGIKIASTVLPEDIIQRAQEIYNELSKNTYLEDIYKEIQNIDINNITPIDALLILNKLLKKCQKTPMNK